MEKYIGDFHDLELIKRRTYPFRISLDKLDKYYNFTDKWNNNHSTNCYAYALGLDINEFKIGYCAFQPGIIYCLYNKVDIMRLHDYSFNERLLLDLKTLRINITTNNNYDWEIALFENRRDFHFIRKTDSAFWSHKKGYFNNPNYFDDNSSTIINPTDAVFKGINGQYRFVSEYKLSLKR